MTDSVEAAGPTAGLVGAFERAEADSAGPAGRAQGELTPSDPGQRDLRLGARNPEDASADLAAIAADPTAPGGRRAGARGKRAMNRALNGLDGALEALRTAFAAEGATEAAESVGDSLAQLRDSRSQLTNPFDPLVRAP